MLIKRIVSGTAAVAIAAVLTMASQAPAWAGHASVETTTQGNSGKTNENANPDNNGQVTTTTTGPKGQVDKGRTDCNNCDTSTSGPGNK